MIFSPSRSYTTQYGTLTSLRGRHSSELAGVLADEIELHGSLIVPDDVLYFGPSLERLLMHVVDHLLDGIWAFGFLALTHHGQYHIVREMPFVRSSPRRSSR